jgi:hypothetical protein
MNLNNNQDLFGRKENKYHFNSVRINNENKLINSKVEENINELKNINNIEKEINNDENINNSNNNLNDKKISNLLYLLKQMSDKQLYLLDVISNLQKNSSEQINNLNNRIKALEEKIVQQNNNISENSEEKLSANDNNINENDPNIILSRILNSNNNEELIKCLNGFNLSQIKKLDIKLIEDALMRLCILLTEGFKIHEIIGFIKGILIINKIKLKVITKRNLKDIFIFIQNNINNLKDEDLIDISLIISYLNI